MSDSNGKLTTGTAALCHAKGNISDIFAVTSGHNLFENKFGQIIYTESAYARLDCAKAGSSGIRINLIDFETSIKYQGLEIDKYDFAILRLDLEGAGVRKVQ